MNSVYAAWSGRSGVRRSALGHRLCREVGRGRAIHDGDRQAAGRRETRSRGLLVARPHRQDTRTDGVEHRLDALGGASGSMGTYRPPAAITAQRDDHLDRA